MEMNENVEMITGDPKKAINKLAWPLIASMLLIFLNNQFFNHFSPWIDRY